MSLGRGPLALGYRQSMPVDVFISHSSDVSQQASYVCARLEAAGITYWIARRSAARAPMGRLAPRASDV